MTGPVPNQPPTSTFSKIMLVGEAPGADEVRAGRPFVGYSGQHLTKLLNMAGAPPRESMFLGNVSMWRPTSNSNDIHHLAWNGEEIQEGLRALKEDVATLNPNIIVLFGNTALKAAKDPSRVHPLVGKAFSHSVSDWRGSLFMPEADSPFYGHKCIATYHPAYALRDYSVNPLIIFDLKRAVAEAGDPALLIKPREILVCRTLHEVLNCTEMLKRTKGRTSLDIEGGLSTMSCISFTFSPHSGFVIPFYDKAGHYLWSKEDGPKVWRALASVLEDPSIPKALQAGLYDRFVLTYGYGIRVHGVTDDTMLSGWEVYSQLEKGLAVQTSIYTRQPFYKTDRHSDNDETFFRYNCMDSLVTEEIAQAHEGMLTGERKAHYKFNVACQEPMLYMELRGTRYDTAGAEARRNLLLHKVHEAQARLNRLTGYRFPWQNTNHILDHCRTLMGYKKAVINDWESLRVNCLKPYVDTVPRLITLLHTPSPTLATLGEIEDLCEVSLNVSSPQFRTYLYETLKLPVQWSTPKDRREEPRPTADYEALLKLAKVCVTEAVPEPAPTVIRLAIEIRALSTRAGMLAISADNDGRIRCGYNIVGSYTGRTTSYKSPTGSGYNLQTIPNYTSTVDAPGGVLGDRDLFIADPDHWFFQCDLKGADGWTVAAYAAMLGDPTMLDDYRAGLKPANILCLMLRGVEVPKDRTHLKVACKAVKKDDWDYFACKRVQHGCSYLEGGLTVSRNILKDSEGKLFMTQKECNELKELFFRRYPGIRRWHDWVGSKLRGMGGIPYLTAASGQRCYFFDRPDETLTKAVAFEPQANTSFATNLALLNMWRDRDNQLSSVDGIKLRVEPLHQIHDALTGQFKKVDTDWATSKIRGWFNNPMNIAGQQIVIPFDGGFGESWGNLNEGTI